MKIHLRMFAAAREVAGADAIEIMLPAGACVADVRTALARQLPALAQMSGQLMIAVNHEYAADDAPIPPDAEVACIPPVSGG
ncbi:MAG: MoaD/ThiS family protein [Planctomycetales bacterium]|nr:MoaD/ThiS family protein [Planctomycetales bacterium]